MAEAHEVLTLARRLAAEAAAIQKARYGTKLQIDTKSAAVDLVTEVDRACEKLIVDGIIAARPGDGIVAEEGSSRESTSGWTWVIDPLDGTTNFAHSYPRFCVSIGVSFEGAMQVGVVHDPLMDERFDAVRGEGAQLNGEAIQASAETRLDQALLATGFAYDRRKSEQDNLAQFATMLKTARALRRDGSAALDLCYVAAGRLDGYWEFKLQPWDVAAGALIVEEAGGRTSDLDGGDDHWQGRAVVASNGKLHDAFLAAIRGT